MSQYRTGFAKVIYGTTTVIGSNTEWYSNVTVGNTFKVEGIDAIYDVNGIISDTCIRLGVPYASSSQEGLNYQIHRDFTINNRIPEINEGDRDWPFYITKGLRTIDNLNYITTATQTLDVVNTNPLVAPNGFYQGMIGTLYSIGNTKSGSITMIGGTLANNSTTTTLPAARMAIEDETTAVTYLSLLQGVYKKANTFNFPATKIGYPLYATTSGNMTTTALAAGLYQQIVGIVLATHTVYFNPSFSIVKT